jgi:large subunit ribosomal protein L35
VRRSARPLNSGNLPLYIARAGRFVRRFSVAMQKTKKSVAKRFKLTAKGKLVRRSPGSRHLLAHKSSKQKRRLAKDKLVAPGHAEALLRCLPFGL